MSFLVEPALSAVFDSLLKKLSDVKFATNKQVHVEVEKWERKLEMIKVVLADAEQKQMKNNHPALKTWLFNLQALAYDADDILDEFATEEALGANTSMAQKLIPTRCIGLQPSSIMFNDKMMSRIEEISHNLEGFTKEIKLLKLTNNDVGRPMATQNKSSQSSSVLDGAIVYGREAEKVKLLDLLLRNDCSKEGGFSVIPIVGMGGIGKTTLARIVYNESKGHFDVPVWACVSDEFDITQVTKTILGSVAPQSCNSNDDLDSLQVKLKEGLSGKKFLIVLDDVWNENYEDWINLRSPFFAGAPGSKIIVTTRSSGVSSNMKPDPDFPDFSLQKLTEDDSLSILAYHALGKRDFSSHLDLKDIGLQIVQKCDGLPLATKIIGGLLRTQIDRDAWKYILRSEIWRNPSEKNSILPSLQLSYYHLSSRLKQCFAYCSLVPKDHEFTEQEIVLLWMAEGFLNGENSKKEIEDSGKRCFRELVSRSFFQKSDMNKSHFVMHDLINDLAQSVAGKAFFRMEGDEPKELSKEIRHSSYIMGRFDGIKKFKSFYETKHLRTFLPFMRPDITCHLSSDVVTDLLPKLRCLRVLSLKRYSISEMSGFIGDLKHLRYLDFSYTEIQSLPDSICTLYNLETLLLRGCWYLKKLPSKIGMLVNLCHLDIADTNSIKEMPRGIGVLRNLRTLSKFIVGPHDGLNIREMQNLSNLKGHLSISNLQNVDETRYASEAELSSKADLDSLELLWSENFNKNLRKKEVEEEVLRLLQPHKDLKVLTIRYYAGTLLPTWVGDPLFKNLQSLRLVGCQNCTELPSVGKLPLLKDLYIEGMSNVSCIGNEFYGENWQNVFPSLETLHFEDMPEWNEWKPSEVDEEGPKFPHLRELFIEKCPKLIGSLPNGLQSLEKLVIDDCQELVVTISNLQKLSELRIHTCKEVELQGSIELWSMKRIHLSNIPKFACVGEEAMMSKSIEVENLRIDGCKEQNSWDKNEHWLEFSRSLCTLQFRRCQQVLCIGATTEEEEAEGLLQSEVRCNIFDVRITYCEGLEKLSNTFNNLTCLKVFEECPKLVTISVDNLPPTLKALEIGNCESLQYLLDDGENTNFSSTSLLESLEVNGCGGLQSLSASGKLPAALKSLVIRRCPSLEVIAGEFGDNACLEYIRLVDCENIKYLSQGVNKLSRLYSFSVSKCPNLICFPKSGLPTTPNLIPERGLPLPTTLSSLDLHYEPNVSKALMEWEGLHTLTSLKYLNINGSNCTDTVSFPQSQEEQMGMNVMNMKLPPSLIDLMMRDFINLRKLSSSGFQNLTSLQSLSIWRCQKLESLPQNLTSLQSLDIDDCPKLKSLPQNLTSLQTLDISDCPKLKSLPKKEMLPSLSQLSIEDCPELKKRCKRDKGKLWSLISHIPEVDIRD